MQQQKKRKGRIPKPRVACQGCGASPYRPYTANALYCNSCKNAINKAYRLANPEASRAYDKRRRARQKLADPKLVWARTALASSKRRAKAGGVQHCLTVNYLLSIAPSVCPVFGTPLNYAGSRLSDDTATVDRHIGSKGYVEENVSVVSWRANRIKLGSTYKELLQVGNWLREILENETS